MSAANRCRLALSLVIPTLLTFTNVGPVLAQDGSGDETVDLAALLSGEEEGGGQVQPGNEAFPLGSLHKGVPAFSVVPDIDPNDPFSPISDDPITFGVARDGIGDVVTINGKGKAVQEGGHDAIVARSGSLPGEAVVDRFGGGATHGAVEAISKAPNVSFVQLFVNGIAGGPGTTYMVAWDGNGNPKDDGFRSVDHLEPGCANDATIFLSSDADGKTTFTTYGGNKVKRPKAAAFLDGRSVTFAFIPARNAAPHICAGVLHAVAGSPPFVDMIDPPFPLRGLYSLFFGNVGYKVTGKGNSHDVEITFTADVPAVYDGQEMTLPLALNGPKLGKKSNWVTVVIHCEGKTCRLVFKSRGQKSDNLAVGVPTFPAGLNLEAVASALAYLQEAGVAHADITPEMASQQIQAEFQREFDRTSSHVYVPKGESFLLGGPPIEGDVGLDLGFLGDVNADGCIDAHDRDAIELSLGQTNPDEIELGVQVPYTEWVQAYDLDGDGKITTLDLAIVDENIGLGCTEGAV